ncbi:hypothetical protein AKJ09_00794 [Labilithrix luteola]|uniref:Uncharacterized protein n=1 Tax=Labilithrix luteola TaxID=1391654 RepID=A0A0K1PKS6_9BACT|nr:hypothetical protein AKJ09_00794 [Labilithrix luteola]
MTRSAAETRAPPKKRASEGESRKPNRVPPVNEDYAGVYVARFYAKFRRYWYTNGTRSRRRRAVSVAVDAALEEKLTPKSTDGAPAMPSTN